MGKKKKTYDIFDQHKPVTSVRLPQLDPRQPDDSNWMEGKNVTTKPAITKSECQLSESSEARSNDSSNLSKTASTIVGRSGSIRVKIPPLTHEVRPEPSSTSCPSLAASLHNQKTSHYNNGGRGHSSLLTNKGLNGASAKQTKVSPQLTGPVQTLISATLSGKPSGKDLKVTRRQGVLVASRCQSDRGKRDPVKADTQVSRAYYHKQETSTNGKGRKGGASKMKPSITSPPLLSSPKVSHHHPKLTSSPQNWTDYANHTSNADHRGAPSRSSKFPRGRMSQRGSSSVQRLRGTAQRQHGARVARPHSDWTTWVEVWITIFGLTPNIDTRDLWSNFNKEGNITGIDIFEDYSGSRTGGARIKFSPPPARPFWLADNYRVNNAAETCYVRMDLDEQPRTFKAPSPVNPTKKYDEVMMLKAESIDFGIMYHQNTMMSMFATVPSSEKTIKFRLSMLRREIIVEFELDIFDPRPTDEHPSVGKHNRTETIRFSVPFRQLEEIHRIQPEGHMIMLVMALVQPPRFFRKVDEIHTHEDNGRYWTQNDAWYRQTDILYDPKSLASSPLTLRKFRPIIDIGRWTTYHFKFDMRTNDRKIFNEMCQALHDHNIRLTPFPGFRLIKDQEPAVWEFIDRPTKVLRQPKNTFEELTEDVVPPLSFPVRFQLEVCISQGVLNEHNLTLNFVTRLMEMGPTKAQDVLEYIANQKKRLYDPMQIFSMKVTRGSASRKIPSYCAYIRSATVTPSTVYYNTPTVETSNRVIRQYAEYADRFLRVRFTDEKSQGPIFSTDKDTTNEVFTRVKRTMNNGITIGERHYKFLAFGNSQFRENGAYFFAPLPHLSTRHIRHWMGDFSEIREIAKHAARLGQCFSTTRAINCARVTIVEIDDIELKRKGKKYSFTDGVGKISPFLAQLAAGELNLLASEPPSVFQFRLGGCKGVLAVWPEAKDREIHLRFSQYKFPAKHEGLEIIRWSQMASANLNRQLILVLSSLGVADDVFMSKLKMQLAQLEQAMTEEKSALELLQKVIDPNHMTLALAGMILDGFQNTREPFLVSLLHLWRAWSIKYLKEKARISISDGALLLGCVDETGTLKGHYDGVVISNNMTLQEKEALLPEVFVQLSKGPDNKPWVVKGPMLLARNPSLHPGDIRVVRGVDVPVLHHLKDVVVLPQTGDRDISSMCSGGDLDGDDYIVMWDKDLRPAEWNHEPMDYTAPSPLKVDRDVTTDDITSFFVTYMRNNTLATIAQAHLALADKSDHGIKDERCLELCRLHSKAVDYNKSGIPARMTRDLYPRGWPHFMDRKPKEKMYKSSRILGRLYDQVECVDFAPAFDLPFDQRILHAYRLDSKIIQTAANLKVQYDAAIRRIMAQHEIKTEFEVWSTFVLEHSNAVKDYNFHEEIGALSQALKDEFQAECYRKAGGREFEIIAPFVAAMYHVTNEEMQLALSECHTMVNVDGVDTPKRKMASASMPLMSFPWLFQTILGRIANAESTVTNDDTFKPIQGQSKRSATKKQLFDNVGEELLLETADGVTHRGENLVLFENMENDKNSGEQQYHPESNSAFSSVVSDSVPTGSEGKNLALDNGEAQVEASGIATPMSAIISQSGSSISPKSMNSNHEHSPDSNSLDELFQREGKDIGTVSGLLTPTDSPLPFSSPEKATRESHSFSDESLINGGDSGSQAGDEWEESEDEGGSSEGSVEVHIANKGPSYLDRLMRLNET